MRTSHSPEFSALGKLGDIGFDDAVPYLKTLVESDNESRRNVVDDVLTQLGEGEFVENIRKLESEHRIAIPLSARLDLIFPNYAEATC